MIIIDKRTIKEDGVYEIGEFKGRKRYKKQFVVPIKGTDRKEGRYFRATSKQGVIDKIEAHIKDAENYNSTMPIKFREVASLYLDTKAISCRNTTLTGYRGSVRFLLPIMGEQEIGSITTATIQGIANELHIGYLSGKYRSNYKKHLNRLESILAFSKVMGYISSNPYTDITIQKTRKNDKDKPFTIDEIQRIREHFSTRDDFDGRRFRAFTELLIKTGLRKSEALALTWEDLANGMVSVSKQQAEGRNDAPLKTHSSKRTIRLPDVDFIEEWKDYRKGIKYSEWVFNGIRGGICHGSDFSQKFKKELMSIGIKGKSFHAFRHYHASALMTKGHPVLAVSKHLGHSDTTTLQRIYAHPLENENERLTRDLGEL